MTGRGLWGQGISGPAQPRTKLLRVGHCRMSFLIILYVTNYSSECHSKPNGQKALGPKDPLQHPLPVWDEGRTWTNSEQGACHNGSSVPFLQRRVRTHATVSRPLRSECICTVTRILRRGHCPLQHLGQNM